MSNPRVVICGSRGWSDSFRIYERVGQLPVGTIVIVGGARGADELTVEAATQQGYHTAIVEPLWTLHKKAAGPLRNLAMLDLEPSVVVAFWDGQSAGTRHTIHEAERRNIPTEVILKDPPISAECPGCKGMGERRVREAGGMRWRWCRPCSGTGKVALSTSEPLGEKR